MAMSRKHYTEVAGIVKVTLDGYGITPDNAIAYDAIESLTNGLADMFKRDNSAFDRARFLDACGLGD